MMTMKGKQMGLEFLRVSGLACAVLAGACGDVGGMSDDPASETGDVAGSRLSALIGSSGGVLAGAPGSQFEGVKLVIPAGALSEETEITITPADDGTPLPSTAVRCGEQFALAPAGLVLAQPATLTLPFDPKAVTKNLRFADEVKVWALDGAEWGRREQTDSDEKTVSVQLGALTTAAAGVNPPAEKDIVHFEMLAAGAKNVPCFAGWPNDPAHAPEVDVYIVRGEQNDGMFVLGDGFKPNIQFDLFSTERTPLGVDGQPSADFKGFGLVWYQSDLHVDEHGDMLAAVRTILLDQIFGFDSDVSLAPTNTFNLGFWFNNPEDAVACGFDASKPTPFNGEHKAGPLAMVTKLEASGLGPLCTKPDTSVSPARCDP